MAVCRHIVETGMERGMREGEGDCEREEECEKLGVEGKGRGEH